MSLKVDGAQIDATAHQLAGALAAIEHELEQLVSAVSSVRGQWSGDAQHAFDAAHSQWQRETRVMADILGQAIGALRTANTSAGDAERAATALWQ